MPQKQDSMQTSKPDSTPGSVPSVAQQVETAAAMLGVPASELKIRMLPQPGVFDRLRPPKP